MLTGAVPYVSVIIPTYNRSLQLAQVIESFLAQDYPKDRYEIVVADNNSTDSTREVVTRYVGSTAVHVRYIFEHRQGVHYARNRAAIETTGELLYFTDDDMIAEATLLSELVKVFDLDPRIATATGKIIGKFQVPPPQWVRKYLVNSYLSLTEEDKPESLIVSSTDMVYSCHQAVKRAPFFECGGYNPENTAGVWIGDGETGLGIKLKKAGYLFAYTAKSVTQHVIPPERMTLAYLVKRIGNQGFCDSYTDYRTHRRKDRIIPLLLVRSTLGALKVCAITVAMIMLRRESWHFLPARLAYLFKRNVYDLKLFLDEGFRKQAEIDDWLNVGT